MQTVVILGTGTGVGKTYITRALANLLVGQFTGPVLGLKPIESGLSADENGKNSDAAVLAACSRPPFAVEHAYGLKEGVSPHLAAQNEGTQIHLDFVERWVRKRTAELTHGAAGWVLIETAGGAFTPLSALATNVTLATRFEPALWVLVAPDRLGVLHDLSATLIALERIARKPDLVLLNAPPVADASTGKNRTEIERLGIASVAGCVERNGPVAHSDQAAILRRLTPNDTPEPARHL
jgi:dethiobiotin synthetase